MKLAAILCNRLDACHMDVPYGLWYYQVRLCEGSVSCSCQPRFLHASVVVILECRVHVHSHTEPVCRLPVEPCEPVSNPYLCCQFWPEVSLVALSVCEQCRLCLSVADL